MDYNVMCQETHMSLEINRVSAFHMMCNPCPSHIYPLQSQTVKRKIGKVSMKYKMEFKPEMGPAARENIFSTIVIAQVWTPTFLGDHILKCMPKSPRGYFNLKITPYQNRNAYHKDKTLPLLCYIYDENPYFWKESLYIEMGPVMSIF